MRTDDGEVRDDAFDLTQPMGEAEIRALVVQGILLTKEGINVPPCFSDSNCPYPPIPPVGTEEFEKRRCVWGCCDLDSNSGGILSQIAKREFCYNEAGILHRNATPNMAEYEKALSQYYLDAEAWVKRYKEKKRMKKAYAIIGPFAIIFMIFLVVFCGKTIIKDWKAGTKIREKNRIRRRIEKENARILQEKREGEIAEEVMREMRKSKGE